MSFIGAQVYKFDISFKVNEFYWYEKTPETKYTNILF